MTSERRTVKAKTRTRRPALLDLDLALRAERKLQRYGLTLNDALAEIVKSRGLPKLAVYIREDMAARQLAAMRKTAGKWED